MVRNRPRRSPLRAALALLFLVALAGATLLVSTRYVEVGVLRVPDVTGQNVAEASRALSRLGFEVGLAGHFTARDPILLDHFWVNPLGMSFAEIRASDLILMSPAGEVVEGEGMVNLSGVPYHDAIQRARPEVVGIAHAHAFHAKVWSAFGRVLDPITADVINDLIVRCVRQLGATALSITHDMASVRKIADEVAMLYDGRILWQGPSRDIDRSGNPFVDQFVHGHAEGPIKVAGLVRA